MTRNRRRWRLFLVVPVLLSLIADAAATSCRRRDLDADESRRMFGEAERVFIGQLLHVLDEPRASPPSAHCDAECNESGGAVLEPISVGYDEIPDTVAEFLVDTVYKGDSAERVRVRAALEPDTRGRYLVYAFADPDAGGELVVRHGCGASLFDLEYDHAAELTAGLLPHLDDLPPPGSGGSVLVRGFLEPTPRGWSHTTLRFVGAQHRFEIVLDARGEGRRDGIPAGEYRLETTPPSGFVVECGAPASSCDALQVHDRGLDDWTLRVRAPAELEIRLLDAQGRDVGARAEFDLLDPVSGEVQAWYPESGAYSPTEFIQQGRAFPGRVVLALVLSEIVEDTHGVRRVSQRRHVLNRGASRLSEAEVLTVAAGPNRAQFHLPIDLQPQRMALSGLRPAGTSQDFLHVRLLARAEVGDAAGEVLLPTESADVVWALPGQTLLVSGYQQISGRTRIWTRSLRVPSAVALPAPMRPDTPVDARE